jgi:oligopeptide/dipeptide ABC transporter ATP-binding protein
VLAGELPNPSKPPSGCRFHTRCPAVHERCRREQPDAIPVDSTHWAACHLLSEPGPGAAPPTRPIETVG